MCIHCGHELFFGKDENLKKYWMVHSMRDLHALVLESHLWFGFVHLYCPLLQVAKTHLLMALLPFSTSHKQLMCKVPFQSF